MKKLLKTLILFISLILIYIYRTNIMRFFIENFTSQNTNQLTQEQSPYYRDYNLSYFGIKDDINIENKQDLLNLYYTIINKGITKFSFYCPTSYKSCIDDVIYMSNNQKLLSNINSFVNPFNSFTSIKTEYDKLQKVTLEITPRYSEEKINKINTKINEIIKNQVKNETDTRKIIKIIHDYIINNTKYDKERADNKIVTYDSSTAYGVLLEGYGLCGGYADAMALFLDYYEIPNFKVVSENHTWNAVYLDNKWYHLDLTWDDPITTNNEDTLEYTFFLITTYELEHLQTNQHIYNKTIFKEIA